MEVKICTQLRSSSVVPRNLWDIGRKDLIDSPFITNNKLSPWFTNISNIYNTSFISNLNGYIWLLQKM